MVKFACDDPEPTRKLADKDEPKVRKLVPTDDDAFEDYMQILRELKASDTPDRIGSRLDVLLRMRNAAAKETSGLKPGLPNTNDGLKPPKTE